MIKIVLLLHRRPDLSPEEFRRHWHDVHRPLLERLPGLQRLVLNEVLPGPDGTPPPYDGIAEDWFDSVEAMQAAFASPEAQAVAADTANFLGMSRFQVLAVAEHEVPLPLTRRA
jgi:uncharacterized protein (TIGR02118 family)